jgi:hypothetical protein
LHPWLWGNCVYQSIARAKAQIEFGNQLDVLGANQDKGQKQMASNLADVSTKLSEANALREQYARLVENILTNHSFSTEARQAAINSDIKFQDLNSQADDANVWLASQRARYKDMLASIQIAEQTQRRENFKPVAAKYQTYLPYLIYFVDSFTNMLAKVAKATGDEMESNYKGLPRNIHVDVQNTNVADIKFKNNSALRFQLILYPPSETTLTIEGGDSHLALRTSGHGEREVPGLPMHDFDFASGDFKKIIDDELRFLIGYKDSKSSKTKK